MAKDKDHQGIWFSGEICEIPGTYFADCCDIRFELKFTQKDVFVRCPSCRKKIKWERVNGGA